MMMVELNPVPGSALPVAELTEHLRLSSGFADDGSYDAHLEALLRAALAAIEARTGKAIFTRGFRWELTSWSDTGRQALPIAPLVSLDAVNLVQGDGSLNPAAVDQFTIEPDAHRPAIVARTGVLPGSGGGAQVQVVLTAGYGAQWDQVPPDLREAVLTLAGDLFDHGDEQAEVGWRFPAAVQLLIEPYRSVRMRSVRA